MSTVNHSPWLDVVIPSPSTQLQVLLERMNARLEPLSLSVSEAIISTVSDYELTNDSALREELRRTAEINARIWSRTLLSGIPPTASEFTAVAENSRRRVHQGISLSSLLRAYRIGSRALWMEMLKEAGDNRELQYELLVQVSPYFMHYFDLLAQSMALAWTAEQHQQERWRDRLRNELWTVISVRPEDVEAFRRHIADLGLDATVQVCAIVVHPATSLALTANLERVTDIMVTQIARVAGVARNRLMWAIHHDLLIVWVAANHGELLIDHCRRVNDLAVSVARQVENVASVGAGLPGIGPRGWQASAGQAERAESHTEGSKRGVSCYSDIVLDDLVTTSDNVKRFFDALIERLAVEPQLLETLSTYFELGQHRKAVAGALSVHPNTLDHRLERIEQIFGSSMNDMAWMAKLHTALRISRTRPEVAP
ncbi:MAG: helix-turn-helix domain-containing protein [Pseudomonadota bacterium]